MTSVYLYDSRDRSKDRVAQFKTLRDAQIYAEDTHNMYPTCDIEMRDGNKIVGFLCSKIRGAL